MQKSFLAIGLVVAVLAAPALASAARADGVVVKVDAKTRQIALAQARGRVALVHLQSLPRVSVGHRVQLNLRALHNGTYAGSALRVVGSARSTHVRGYVVAVRRARGTFTLAAHGAVLTIYPKRGVRTTQAVHGGPPAVGSEVDATVSADANGQLQAAQVVQVSPVASAAAIGGKLTAMAGGKLTVTNDGASITLTVAPGFDLSHFKVGDDVLAYFSKLPDGSLGLTALTGNGTAAEADDQQESAGDVSGAQNEVDNEDQNQARQDQCQQDQSQQDEGDGSCGSEGDD